MARPAGLLRYHGITLGRGQMKQFVALVALAGTSLVLGQTITQAERDFAVRNLQASRKKFLDSIAGLSEAQWKFKPAPDRWSVAECAEHIALSELLIMQLVTEKILKSEPVPRQTPASREADEALIGKVRDRDTKATAPEFLKPSGKFPDRGAVVADFNANRDRTIAFVEKTQDDLRGHSIEHPLLKQLDAYQWILLIAAHSERHTAQIEEVKATPGFPGR